MMGWWIPCIAVLETGNSLAVQQLNKYLSIFLSPSHFLILASSYLNSQKLIKVLTDSSITPVILKLRQ